MGASNIDSSRQSIAVGCLEIGLVVSLFYVYAGDPPPGVNEAHYLVKAKNFWEPTWCQEDLFAASGKAHTTFYVLFGWPAKYFSLATTAWMGRIAGWFMLAIGLLRLTRAITSAPMMSLAIAVMWIAGIDYGDLAGEWVVGGIEAKVPAYGLVLCGMADLIQRRWRNVWIWFGAASAFHVLTGGWSVIAGILCFALTENGAVKNRLAKIGLSGLFIGGVLSLFGLAPALWLTSSATPEQSATAADIYVFTRLGHHLSPSAFQWHWYVRHGVLIAVMIWLTSRTSDPVSRRLGWFGGGAVAIAVAGLAIGFLPLDRELAAKLLRYYFFRLTDAVVPLVVAGLIVRSAFTVSRPKQSTDKPKPGSTQFMIACVAIVIGIVLTGASTYERAILAVPPSASHKLLGRDIDASPEQQRKTFADWLAVCRWVRIATPKNEIFLTPRHQQSFKWYAHRAEVVNWKDVPQDASSLIEWEKRFNEIFPSNEGRNFLGRVRVTINYNRLREFRHKYNVRFIIVDRRVTGPNLPFIKIYPIDDESNETYAVYELPYPIPDEQHLR